MERRAASAPAPARDSRLQQDIDSGMHPRAARKADKGRQRAADHQRRLAEEKASKVEQPAKSRSRRPSPRRESRPEGRHPSPRRHRSGKERSDRKRRQLQEEEDKLTVEEEEALISAQLEEVHESPAVKEQIARVLREAYRERFGEQILNQDHPRGQAGHIRILWMSLMTFHHLSWMNWRKGLVKALISPLKARLD